MALHWVLASQVLCFAFIVGLLRLTALHQRGVSTSVCVNSVALPNSCCLLCVNDAPSTRTFRILLQEEILHTMCALLRLQCCLKDFFTCVECWKHSHALCCDCSMITSYLPAAIHAWLSIPCSMLQALASQNLCCLLCFCYAASRTKCNVSFVANAALSHLKTFCALLWVLAKQVHAVHCFLLQSVPESLCAMTAAWSHLPRPKSHRLSAAPHVQDHCRLQCFSGACSPLL